eukprot:9494950-Pyramimonas_sp.AAC.1
MMKPPRKKMGMQRAVESDGAPMPRELNKAIQGVGGRRPQDLQEEAGAQGSRTPAVWYLWMTPWYL